MRPRTPVAGAVLLVLASTAAHAGLIYGSIRTASGPLAKRALTLDCGEASFDSATDERGSYRINATAEGKCELSLVHEDRPLSTTVYSEPGKPVRYDLEVVRDEDGAWTLRRR